MAQRQLKLGAFMRPISIHTGAWRYPGAWPDANFNFGHIKQLIRKLEAGKFDAFFMADHLAVLNMPVNALKRSHTVTSFEPFTLLSALSAVTERIGLIATGSTTFDEPYHVARRFASLDHLSGGRAGWNIVTTSNPDAALNFGLDDHMEHAERYKRAREFYDVVTGLWDSFADDAFVRDVESGLFFEPSKMHVLDHQGKYFKVRGPLNIARPVQGWPVIVQAGASEDGRQLAAETAEAVFTGGGGLSDGQKLYADIKGRMEKVGRDPEHLKILPGAFVVVGDSVDEAREKRALLDSRVHYDSAIRLAVRHPRHRCLRLRSRRSAPRHPGDQRQQERPPAHGGSRRARQAHGAPARPARRRLWRTVFRRHRQDHRRPDGGMAGRARLRRIQHHVSVPARRPRGFRRQGGPGAPAPRDFPQGV
ncbi:FMN-dependent oxidoreductase (nitrilotriacetate monooxygenase family) [Bradyrhizobium sp. LM2.7]